MSLGFCRARLFFLMSAVIHLIVVAAFLWADRSSEASFDLLGPLTEFSLITTKGHTGNSNAAVQRPFQNSSLPSKNNPIDPKGSAVASQQEMVSPTAGVGALGDGDGPVGIEQLLERPRVLKEVKASYPIAAKQKGLEGVVKLQVVVSRLGKVESAEVLEGPDFELNQAAQAALMQFEFTPALTKEGPRRFQLIYKYNFKLDTQ